MYKEMGWFLRLITPKWVVAITIYPWIFSREAMSEETLNHERIHLAQQKEMFVIPFFLLYIIEWVLRLPFGNAYKNISFEREAYANENNHSYLNDRKKYSNINYITRKKIKCK